MANEFKVKNGLISQEYAAIYGSVKATNLPKSTTPYYYVGLNSSDNQLVLARDPYLQVLNEGFGRVLTTNDTTYQVYAVKDIQLIPRTSPKAPYYPSNSEPWQLTLYPSGSTILEMSASAQSYDYYPLWNTHFLQVTSVSTNNDISGSAFLQSNKVIVPYNSSTTIFSFPYADYTALRFEYTAYNKVGSPGDVVDARSGVIRVIWDENGNVGSGDWNHTATAAIGNTKDLTWSVNKIGSNIAIGVQNQLASGIWVKVSYKAIFQKIVNP